MADSPAQGIEGRKADTQLYNNDRVRQTAVDTFRRGFEDFGESL